MSTRCRIALLKVQFLTQPTTLSISLSLSLLANTVMEISPCACTIKTGWHAFKSIKDRKIFHGGLQWQPGLSFVKFLALTTEYLVTVDPVLYSDKTL